jgi:CheY-like chemotaxis protein
VPAGPVPTSSESATAAAPAAAAQTEADPAAAANGNASRRVLVVERDGEASEVIRGLADQGVVAAVSSVSGVDEAARRLESEAFDCLVTGGGISKAAAFRLLAAADGDPRLRGATFLMLPQRPLTERELARLRRPATLGAVKAVASRDELAAEAAIALHRSDPWRSAGAAGHVGSYDAERLRGRKVLLVDDDVRNLFALASLLEDRGMEVIFGETGKEALSALERHQDIDIALMDIMMPDMDGNETIAAIRRTPGLRDLPIIAVTAKALEGDRQRSLEVGASDYLTKPVDPDRLLSLIASWLQR